MHAAGKTNDYLTREFEQTHLGVDEWKAGKIESDAPQELSHPAEGYPEGMGKPEARRSGKSSSPSLFRDRLAAGSSFIVSCGVISLLLIIWVTCSHAYKPQDNHVRESKTFPAKPLRTVIVPDYYPYTFVNEKGMPDGFSVDLAKAVVQAMDRTVEIGVDTWEHAKEALEKGTIDFLPMMASSYLRRQSFDFTVPHTIAYDAVFLRKGTQGIGSLNDLSGKTIIVMNKDAAHDVISATPTSDTIKLILVDSLPDGLRLLVSGKGDAAIMPKLVGILLLKRLGITNLEESPATIESYHRPFSFAVKKGNAALLERLTQGLSIVESDGRYRAIYEKWFGVLAPPGLPWTSALKYLAFVVALSALLGLILLVWSLSLKKLVKQRTKTLESEIAVRKKTEEALRASEDRFRRLSENAKDTIYRMSLPDGRYEYVSPASSEMFGYSPEEFYAAPNLIRKIIHPDWLGYFEEEWEKLISGRMPPFYEYQVVHKSGDFRWINQRNVLIRDDLGRPVAIEGVATDVTERKWRDEALRESEEKYRTLFEESFDGLFITSPGGKILDMNRKGIAMFGYDTKEEILSLDLERDVYANPADRARILSMVNARGSAEYEVVVKKKSGEEMITYCSLTAVKDEKGETTSYRGIIRDITEQKSIQRQLLQAQKMEAIGTLAGGIAHDFNNLLTVVLGFSELLLAGKDERDPSCDDLQKIRQAARNGADLVKRILAFGRKAEFIPSPLDLNHQIEQVKRLLARTIPKMIDIEIALSDEPATVNADPVQIEQVLMNLAVNAMDAMPEGGKLTIETKSVALDEEFCRMHPGASPGDYVLLCVSDTGHGMDKETLSRIFEPFFSTKGVGQGTGLGLAVVYGIVKQHGGYITCYSEPGLGATFRIYLPVFTAQLRPQSPKRTPELPRGTEKILLVDDEEYVRELGRRILERSGYTVLTAANGREALDLYENGKETISLVILDLIMPEVGGKECLEKLLKIEPRVKVLIASGYAPERKTQDIIESGVRGFVAKPFDITEMLHTVRQVLDSD